VSHAKGTEVSAARDHWQEVLLSGAMATIPRWSATHRPTAVALTPGSGAETVSACERLAGAVGVPVGAVLLGVHAKVVSLLSGERRVRVGYRIGERDLPCTVNVEQGTWRRLIEQAWQATRATARYKDHPVTELARELGVPFPLFETVADASTDPDPPLGGAVARVFLSEDGLRVRYRCDVADADYAARIARYHHAAVLAANAEPDTAHREACLLSEEELRHQDGELAGRPRQLPEQRFHELFEERAREHPTAVAAMLGDARLSYGELNERANQIARALLNRGLRREDVVAVCAERHLDWAAAVISVFKAGGVYLPVSPQFPGPRIAAMLSRSGCRQVLADGPGRLAVGGMGDVIALDELRGPAGEPDPGVAVGARQAAYIYFTSGSTGLPKGAMCEQAGMLNHLLAKVADLGIGPGTRVAQTASQCFDISLWQLLAPLLVGGSAVLIPQSAQLDLEGFIRALDRHHIQVLQVVPSYLELLVAHFERRTHRPSRLRTVSVTGEALPYGLVQRWFGQCPGTRLVNAYGATEASDDTTHEVMEEAPREHRVPLGRPIAGARVHVVDENLLPVPLGSPGEIVFSGVCVGRGYVNDEERTRSAFTTDPRHPDQRLYRSGDFGRWTPGGKLEFIGRRDSQVKIRGIRVEIGEVEEQLRRVPGVHEAAVIAAGTSAESRLIGCYCASPALPANAVPHALAAALPDYMIPSRLWWLDALPLTDNGKVDRKALASITTESRQPVPMAARSRTAAGRELAGAWAYVLGVDTDAVADDQNFFDHGGTSLSALRLAIQLDMRVSLADITRYPIFADLARRLDRQAAARDGLVLRLSAQDEKEDAMLLCFPYAGGYAVTYRPLAEALRGTGIAVFAVETSGSTHAPASWVDALAEAVAAEVADLPAIPILLWGHSAGAAPALEAARLLRRDGHDVRRVFIGAQLPGSAEDRGRSIRLTGMLTDSQIMTDLSAQTGHMELAGLEERHVARLAAAYRRESLGADHYFRRLLGAASAPLDIPISVVLAADDEGLEPHRADHCAWHRVAERVDLHELADGGHNFVVTRPGQVASIVASTWPTRDSGHARK
jgi:amino acid adenylation domain-containing protein